MIIRLKQAAAILIVLILVSTVNYADVGPKPSLRIFVINAESRSYYLDLLVQGDDEFYNEFNRRYTDEFKDTPIYKYRVDNWMAKHIRSFLLFGSIQGSYNNKTKMMVHTFSYHDVPQNFKIIIQKENGELYVTDTINTHQFNANVILDMQSGRTQIVRDLHIGFISNIASLLKTVAICMLLTLLIELLIALPFKIKPLKVVFLANIISQLFLHSILILFFYLKLYEYMNLVFIASELGVLIIEYIIYNKYLINKGDKKLLYYYLLTANVSTFILGLIIQI